MKKPKIFLLKLLLFLFCCLFVSTFTANIFGQDKSNQQAIDKNETIRNARVYFIRSESRYAKSEALEDEILKQPEVQQWGLIITRDESKAQLIFEVTRKRWSKKYTFVVIDPITNYVLLTGTIRNRWFHRVEHLLARRFVERMKEIR
jgi:hypothetical protein